MVGDRISRVPDRRRSGKRLRRFAMLLVGLWLIAGRPVPDLLLAGPGVVAERRAFLPIPPV